MADEPVITFGPGEGLLPVGHRWCNYCGSTGETWEHDDRPITCVVCKGKRYWNRDDIRDYHKLAPKVCLDCCGEMGHQDPHWMPGEPVLCTFCKQELKTNDLYHEVCNSAFLFQIDRLTWETEIMTTELDKLMKEARTAYESMSDEDKLAHRRDQYISWAYGQLKLSGRDVTKESLAETVDEMIASGKLTLRI